MMIAMKIFLMFVIFKYESSLTNIVANQNFLTEMKEEKVKRKKDCDDGERLIYKFLLVVKRREETEWC